MINLSPPIVASPLPVFSQLQKLGEKTFGRYDRIEISYIIFDKINGALNEAQLRYKASFATLCSVLSATPNSKDLDDGCNGIDDKNASLLMMKFTIEEVEFAINKLGEDVPVNELVDFIFAAQLANADDKRISVEFQKKERESYLQKLEDI
ncbi:unnamed protein product [Lactuca saligna]|uniref:Uncharacterized protein n=1 Tax=Lactuca saligna TaxID=75948 RepID=A0AA35YKR0_LACSI|nr:unnamed protein product [Lactuca saligna]